MSEVHEAVGSYVVDALESAERAEFDSHLRGCERCQREVAEFSETVAELASLLAVPAPASLRTSVLAAIQPDRPIAASETVRLHRHNSQLAKSGPAALRSSVLTGIDDVRPVVTDEVAPLEEHPSVVPDWSWSVPDDAAEERAARRNRRVIRSLTALAAAAIVVALALGGLVFDLSRQAKTQVAAAQQEAQLLSAPDAKVYRSTVEGASVVYVVSKQRDHALFMATGLPEPGKNQTYQLWTLKGHTSTPAGLLPAGGTVRMLFRVPVHDSDALAISREPSPGGSQALSRPLWQVSI